jgi:hypothetical protein
MDTELLVDDLIEDGRVLLQHLAGVGFKIDVAFWVKHGEDALWRLYIAPAGFSQGDRSGAHATVYDSLDHLPDTSISPSDITLLDPEGPAARAVAALRNRTSAKAPRRYHDKRFGELFAKEAYIYPPIDCSLRQAFIVTYAKRSEANEWTATTQWAESYRGMSAIGTISYSTASWLGEKADDVKFAHVRVLVEVNPEFDDPAILENPVVAVQLLDQARKTADEAFKARHPGASIKHEGALPAAG